MNAPLPIPVSDEERLLTNSPVTTHDIASLAFTRARDPELAMAVATEFGRQHDHDVSLAFLDRYEARQAEIAREKCRAKDIAEWGQEQ